MGLLDVACSESVSVMERTRCSVYDGDILYIGYPFQTYLFFELPTSVFVTPLVSARLILFQIPMQCAGYSTQSIQYQVAPLLDFFTIYQGYYAPPRVDERLQVEYQSQPGVGTSEIDVTEIVTGWINNTPENKGLLFTGEPYSGYLTYASQRYGIAGMRPRLRLVYDGFSWPLRIAPCTVDLQER